MNFLPTTNPVGKNLAVTVVRALQCGSIESRNPCLFQCPIQTLCQSACKHYQLQPISSKSYSLDECIESMQVTVLLGIDVSEIVFVSRVETLNRVGE